MNSESDDDEILTALPLLMAEDMTLQIAQSCEELNDHHSACDNSSGKVQKHLDVKIRSIPSGVQHNSGDKNQGNFNDKVEDNFPAQVQDISVSMQDISNSIDQDKSDIQNRDIQVRDISVQTNSSDKLQTSDYTIPKYSDNKNKCVSNQLQCSLDKETDINSTSEVEVPTAGENSINEIQINLQENSENETSGKSCDIKSQFSSDEENSYCSKTQILKSNPRNTYSKEYITQILREVEMQLQERAHEQLYGKDQVIFRRPRLEFKNAGTTELSQDDVTEHAVFSDNIENTDDNIHDSSEKQNVSDNDIINKSADKIAVNKIDNYLINDMKENEVENQDNSDKAQFSSVSAPKKLNVNLDEIKEDTGKGHKFIIREQDSSNKQSNNENQLKEMRDNFTCSRRLYSQVVKGCKDNVQLNFNDSDDQIISSFGNKADAVFVEVENNFLTNIQDVLVEDQSNNIQIVFPGSDFIIYDQYVSKKEANENKTMQGILSNEQNKLHQEYKDEGLLHTNDIIQDNLGFGRKLYSEVVQENKARVQENCNKTRNDLAIVKYKRFMPIFDHDLESSDDEMDENSNDEMHESSDAEIDENSDAEVKENCNDEVNGELCDIISQFSSGEENVYWSESECFTSFSPYCYYDYSEQYYNEVLKELNKVERELQKKAHEKYAKSQNSNRIVPLYPQLYPVSGTYDAFPIAHSHGGSFQQVNSTDIIYNEMFQCDDDFMTVFNEDKYSTEGKTSSPTPCLIASSAEIVQNLMNQMSTVLPKKTGNFGYYFGSVLKKTKKKKPKEVCFF